MNFLKPFGYLIFSPITTVVSIIFLTPTLIFASDYHNTSKENFLKTIEYIERVGEEIYCYWDLKKEQHAVDWGLIIQRAKNKITSDTTLSDFQSILTEVAAGVHDGHVNYIYHSQKKTFYLPIEVKKLKNDYYIYKVAKDKLWSSAQELSPGDRIIAVNAKPVEQYMNDREKLISGSTQRSIQSRAASSLNSLPKFTITPQHNITLTVEKYATKAHYQIELPWLVFNNHSAHQKKLSDIVSSQILPGNIGLLRLGQMSHAQGKKALIQYIKNEMKALQNTEALLIDVRNNGGGHGEIGDSVIAHLIKNPVKRYQAQLKNSVQAFYARPKLLEIFSQTNPEINEFSEWVDYNIQPMNKNQPIYDKPVSILTNERCFSACDTFVDSFSSNHLGDVLGRQTGGGTGYPLWIDLPYGHGSFRFSILRGYSNHERFLEGTGTLPDHIIEATQDDLHNQVDGELIQAYQYILNKLNKEPLPSLINIHEIKSIDTQGYHQEIMPFFEEEAYWQEIQSH